MQRFSTGFFELIYGNGAIRQIKSGNTEILRMIYPAVRDENWGTLEIQIRSEKTEQKEDGFLIEVTAVYQQGEIHFEADYTVQANGNRLVFEMAGEAKSNFKTNRIGLCVLHPIKECAGRNCRIIHPDGTSEGATFPEQVSPHQPMKNIAAIEWQPAEKIKANVAFSGDIFEMEDQRNWTDASYKTYSRPLELPFPFEMKTGEKIFQRIDLEIQVDAVPPRQKQKTTFHIDFSRKFKLPKIGVGATSRTEPLSEKEAQVLNQFKFDHLRADIKLFRENWNVELVKSVVESNQINLPLFLVLHFSKSFERELNEFKNEVQDISVKIKYILIVGENHLPDDAIFDAVFPELKSLFPKAKIGSGVNAFFAELNRNRPSTTKTEFIGFAVCPQVHAFADLSLVENLEGQKYAVESARQLFPGKPVFVSPVTLKQRFNVVATSDESTLEKGKLPPQVDARQNSVFASQWLAGSLKFLAQSRADVVTFFETAGWRGFIQGDFKPPVPDKFSANKRRRFSGV